MKRLLVVILVVSGVWAGYWFVGSAGVQSAMSGWFEARRAEGWVAETSDLSVQGFPNRFDASLSDVTLADPHTGLAWEAPFFQILSLSYKPNHLIAVWPNAQRFSTPLEKFDVTSEDMRASLVMKPGTALEVRRMTLTSQHITIAPTNEDDPLAVQTLTLAAERNADAPDAEYRLGLRADGLAPSMAWKKLLDPKGKLPKAFDAFSADLAVTFDKPWDRSAIETARPQPTRLVLRLAEARWGQLELAAAGELDVDAAGQPTGSVTIKARNWPEILTLAQSSGILNETLAGTVESGLSLLSRLAGNPETLDIPLGLRNGMIWIGPVPIGAAPILRLR